MSSHYLRIFQQPKSAILLILGFAFESDVEGSVQNQRAGAFRVDKYEGGDTATTPKLGVKWTPAEWIALRATYADVLAEDKNGDIYPLVKAADKLSAYIKCIEERKAGNNEFLSAEAQTRAALEASPLPEVQYFLEHFIPAFERDLDELGAIGQ